MNKTRLNTREAKKIIEAFDYSMYWINALINNGSITKAQAGSILYQKDSL
jgi:hypothetical protein